MSGLLRSDATVLLHPMHAQSPKHHEDQRANSRTYRIRREILPAWNAAGQESLMQLVHHAEEQGADQADRGGAPALPADGKPERHTYSRENTDMRELIPRRRDQIDCERLRAADKQGDADGHKNDGSAKPYVN